MTISVVIPTRNRPGYLREALLSLVAQVRPADEIVVGDDSDDVSVNAPTLNEIAELAKDPKIVYCNERAGGQAQNVDRLFRRATGDYICLLHDDDLLLPNALHDMIGALREGKNQTAIDPVIIYGKQIVIADDGTELTGRTTELNHIYYRTKRRAALLENSAYLAAIAQQAPNDGYLVRRDIAVLVGYVDERAGNACDFNFALKASAYGEFLFVDHFTAKYRLSSDSIGRNSTRATDSSIRAYERLAARGSRDNSSISAYHVMKAQAVFSSHAVVRCARRAKIKAAIQQAVRREELRVALRLLVAADHMASFCTIGFWFRALRVIWLLCCKLLGRIRTSIIWPR